MVLVLAMLVLDMAVLAMLVWDMVVLDMLDMVMVLELMDTPDLDIMARDPLMLNLKPRLMLVFCMEDMDMVLVLAMLVLDMAVLAMLDMDMVLELMDIPDLDITVRDPLMLNLKQKLMLAFFMEDMDMDMVWDMLVWDMVVLDMLDMDMALELMDILDLDIMARDLLKLYLPSYLKQKLKAISDRQCIIQCP